MTLVRERKGRDGKGSAGTRLRAVVIGAGHNGLVAAAYLARAGHRVTVLERDEIIGGATRTGEVSVVGKNGTFLHSRYSYLVSLLHHEVVQELELVRHGLVIVPLESTFNPLPDGRFLYREACPARTYHNIARFSKKDAEAYSRFKLLMSQVAQLVHALQRVTPPPVSRAASQDSDPATAWAEVAGHFASAPRDHCDMLAQMMVGSAADLLDEWFETDALKAALSTSSIIGSFLSPRTPGSAYVLLHHYMGEIDGEYRAWGFPCGGTGAVARAISLAAREAGAVIRTAATVSELRLADGRVDGVVLDDGEEIDADVVLSSLAPQLSIDRLIPHGALPPETVAAANSWQTEGCSAKVNLSLGDLPRFRVRPDPHAHLAGGTSIAPSVDYIERAYADARAGNFSREPFLDLVVPSVIDPGMAPPGGHVMSCFVQYAPYQLAHGTWSDQRDALGDAVMAVLRQYVTNLDEITLDRQVLTPDDVEQEIGIPGGNIFHGEIRLSQLFTLRPGSDLSGFQTPLDGYWLCGSGSHPGGGISGGPGRLAARRVLASLARGDAAGASP